MCIVLLPPGVNPIAVNKYIIYHNIIKSCVLTDCMHIVAYLRDIFVSVTTTWRALALRMEQPSSRYVGYLQMYWSSRRQPLKGGPPAWRLGEVLTTLLCKTLQFYETLYKTSDLDWSFGTTQAVEGIGWEGLNWIYLAQDEGTRWGFVGAVMNLCVPQNAGNLISALFCVVMQRVVLNPYRRFRTSRSHRWRWHRDVLKIR
jgi:hypothetical protein